MCLFGLNKRTQKVLSTGHWLFHFVKLKNKTKN